MEDRTNMMHGGNAGVALLRGLRRSDRRQRRFLLVVGVGVVVVPLLGALLAALL